MPTVTPATSIPSPMTEITLPVASKHVDPANLGAGIELTLHNFSLSIIPSPSLVTLITRKLQFISNRYSWNNTNNTANVDRDSGTASHAPSDNGARMDQDLRNVGINIFRNVDMSVKPGQGTVRFPSTTFMIVSYSS